MREWKPPEASATHVPLKRCRSSLIFNSLILDCIIRWRDKNKSLSQPGATKCQSRSEWRRRRAKRLSAPGGADKQIQSRLCFISCSRRLNCEIKVNRERISLRAGNIGAIMVSSASSQLFLEEVGLRGWGCGSGGGVSLNNIFFGGGKEVEKEAAPVGGAAS